MATLRINEECRALREGVYANATVQRIITSKARVKFGDGESLWLPLSALWKKKRVTTRTATKRRADAYCVKKRLGRFRRLIQVVPTRFERGRKLGDFGQMLGDDAIRMYSVCLFNDNIGQWARGGMGRPQQYAGCGNAVARPYETVGDSIGVPTGPFRSLAETCKVRFEGEEEADMPEHTAKEVIEEAFKRVVRLFLDKPEKDTLYFSVDPFDPPGSVKIGLAVFAGLVGEDVIQEISKGIQEVPTRVETARRTGVRP